MFERSGWPAGDLLDGRQHLRFVEFAVGVEADERLDVLGHGRGHRGARLVIILRPEPQLAPEDLAEDAYLVGREARLRSGQLVGAPGVLVAKQGGGHDLADVVRSRLATGTFANGARTITGTQMRQPPQGVGGERQGTDDRPRDAGGVRSSGRHWPPTYPTAGRRDPRRRRAFAPAAR